MTERGPLYDALVIFMPSGRRGRFARGSALLDAARSLGVYVESVCGGRGICGRCQVTPTFGHFAKHGITCDETHLSAVNEVEQRYAGIKKLPAGRRLSCQTRIDGDLVIDVPVDTAINHQVVRKRAEARAIPVAPSVSLACLTLPPADMVEPLGDVDRLQQMLAEVIGRPIQGVDLHVAARISAVLAEQDGALTAALYDDGTRVSLVGIWPGRREQCLGLAVDIGSTTIAAHLVDLVSGRTLASSGTSNPQIRFGEDLMSRVSYVMMNPDGGIAMTTAVRDAVNALAARVAAQVGVSSSDILDVTVVGNPVMHHLFLGLDPTPLGQAPFALAVSGPLTLVAETVGLALHPGARVHMLPCIAGHVGADAAAVALSELPRDGDEAVLVVDVGTNAEILLACQGRRFAASSPTGPAFEGAQIGSGQRAAPGAIERVRIDPTTLEPRIKIIGSDLWSDDEGFAEAASGLGVTGICGSGIIEALGEMFLAGIITSSGIIDGAQAARSDRVISDGRTFTYVLWRGGIEIRISQADVRAIQLAKAALYAGVRLLMEHAGVERLDRIKLAGAFGTHIDPLYAVLIGMVPDCDVEQVTAVGNAAGTGARMALLNRAHRREVAEIVRTIAKIETALEPRFQALFVDAMAFPNAQDPFPRLSKSIKLPDTPASSHDPARRRGGRRGRSG